MKKIVIITLAALLAVGLLAGCVQLNPSASPSPSPSASAAASQQPTETAPPATSAPAPSVSAETAAPAGNTFTLKNGSMSITPPEGWAATDMSTDTMAVGALVSPDMKGSIALVSMKMPAAPDASAMEQAYSSSAAGAVPGGTVLSQKDITVSGVNGKLMEITGKASGVDAHVLLIVLINGDKIYTATGLAAQADFDTYKAALTDALATLAVK